MGKKINFNYHFEVNHKNARTLTLLILLYASLTSQKSRQPSYLHLDVLPAEVIRFRESVIPFGYPHHCFPRTQSPYNRSPEAVGNTDAVRPLLDLPVLKGAAWTLIQP